MSMPPTFARDFRRTLLWIPRITFLAYLYGAVTLSSLGVPPEFELARSGVPESEHHPATAFQRRLRFALYPLRSPLLRASRLVSFPPRTRMLRFRGFPFLRNNLAVRRSHSEIVGSQVPCAYPTHFAAWHVLRRRPSRAIPQTAC